MEKIPSASIALLPSEQARRLFSACVLTRGVESQKYKRKKKKARLSRANKIRQVTLAITMNVQKKTRNRASLNTENNG